MPNFYFFFKVLLTIVPFTVCSFTNAQKATQISNSYKNYSETAREIVYLHLNKSTYVKGEPIGFKAYVFDKKNKKPSLLTTNLYVSIEDINNNVIKQKLLQVENGIAFNVFEVDSTFKSGDYIVKAYTNWMLNFNEKNYYSESIQVIDLDYNNTAEKPIMENKIDAQFLPESGHLLNGVVNIIGVTLKNQLGHGIPNVKGEVLDEANRIITTFNTSLLGIGKFQLLPNVSNKYTVKIKVENKDYIFDLNQSIEQKGVILSLKKLKNKTILSLITNNETLKDIKNKIYTLMIHNGDKYNTMDISFFNSTKISKVIDSINTLPGMNIITLFNDTNIPVAERLFFNFQGVDIVKSNNVSQINTKDSTTLSISYKAIHPKLLNSISISVMPQETKSYDRHSNIISSTYLEPYINGYIQQAKYYFTDINTKKEYELDNLLITQGWSSYDWDNIFKGAPIISHKFEQGITVKANLYSKDDSKNITNLIYSINNEGFEISQTTANNLDYWIYDLFPEEDSKLTISKTNNKGNLKPVPLYLQFFPSTIPKLKHQNITLTNSHSSKLYLSNNKLRYNNFIVNLNNVQKLDEVIVKSNRVTQEKLKEKERERELNNHRFGKVSVVTEQDENQFIKLMDYLRWKAGILINTRANKTLYNTRRDSFGKPEPISYDSKVNYFLNDVLLIDTTPLEDIYLTSVDYIEVGNRINDGVRSPKGLIKIYTKNLVRAPKKKETSNNYDFPLSFNSKKKYYTPKYRYYEDHLYKSYGVIDWKPNLTIDNKNNITFTIKKTETPAILFIEGITNNGSFIFEEKNISFH